MINSEEKNAPQQIDLKGLRSNQLSEQDIAKLEARLKEAIPELEGQLKSGPIIIGESAHDKPDARAAIYQMLQDGAIRYLSLEVPLPWVGMTTENATAKGSEPLDRFLPSINFKDPEIAAALDVYFHFCPENASNPIKIRTLVDRASSLGNIEVLFHDLPGKDLYQQHKSGNDDIAAKILKISVNEPESVSRAEAYLLMDLASDDNIIFQHAMDMERSPALEAEQETVWRLGQDTEFGCYRNAYLRNILKHRFGNVAATSGLAILCGAGHVDDLFYKGIPQSPSNIRGSLQHLLEIDEKRVHRI